MLPFDTIDTIWHHLEESVERAGYRWGENEETVWRERWGESGDIFGP